MIFFWLGIVNIVSFRYVFVIYIDLLKVLFIGDFRLVFIIIRVYF